MCCMARGLSTGFSLVGPTKVKSFLLTEKFACIQNKVFRLLMNDFYYQRVENEKTIT